MVVSQSSPWSVPFERKHLGWLSPRRTNRLLKPSPYLYADSRDHHAVVDHWFSRFVQWNHQKHLSLAMEGAGNINMWGFSPALDLSVVLDAKTSAVKRADADRAKEGASKAEAGTGSSGQRRLLLVGAGDPRHILLTLSRARRRTSTAEAAGKDAGRRERVGGGGLRSVLFVEWRVS